KEFNRLEGHNLSVNSVRFSLDGKTIAIAIESSVILKNFDLEQLGAIAYEWLRDYLKYNPNITQSDTLRDSCVTPSVVEAGAKPKVDN
ncbi:MAG TPA: hypothetical protein V6C90_04985, partial [Coleofasciculaceae cyanobacterium]